MAKLVLGPLLRYVDETSAAVWVETDEPCEVTVLDAVTRTFTVHGHHYALAEIEGLTPSSSIEYTVDIDGGQVWPPPGEQFPPSRIRTARPTGKQKLLFGSCRISASHDAASVAIHGTDMLRAFAHEIAASPEHDWPDTVLMLGDQVYADEPPEKIRQFIRDRRDTSVDPGEEIADYTEYAQLYRMAWDEPWVRWLLSTIPVLTIFDDHDLRDDWNTSQDWRETMLRQAWWRRRVVAGLGSYWIYQHLGNMSPKERAGDPMLAALRAAEGDGGDVLDDFAWNCDANPEFYRWSYYRDFGTTRLIVLDSRCSRSLTPGQRRMVDAAEWAWFEDLASGETEHLVIGSTLPILLPAGLHYLESWNEAVCDGAWGRRAAVVSEKIRQGIDLEHWGAFRDGFDDMSRLVKDLATGQRGRPPRSIVFLSGDVHYSYLARAGIDGATSTVHQVVCSPIRNPLSRLFRLANVIASFVIAGVLGYLLARMAGVRRTLFDWRVNRGPWFDNALAVLDLDGPVATVSWHTAADTTDVPAPLTRLGSQPLTPPPN
jgi:phosphodiesterase/alkaline phosphatase D-like protein